MIPESPFSKTDLQPIEDVYEKRGSLMGLRLPNGKVLLNYEHGTKNSLLADIAKQIGAETIVVKGTWKFIPDRLENESNT